LASYVEQRLGRDHPLLGVLPAAVAYHHGSLPLDVRSAIEQALRDGTLRTLVATTSLTEGVNLPVRSVVVASQGMPWSDEDRRFISGSRLVNAIGRAGRATLETEGVVVLARQAEFSLDDFDELDPRPEELSAMSVLTDGQTLEAFAAIEHAIRESQDAILEIEDETAATFVSYVWFVAAELERLDQAITPDRLHEWLRRTLAWTQLDSAQREALTGVADASLEAYEQTPPGQRRRWARSGASLATSSAIEEVARELSIVAFESANDEALADVLVRILDDGRLDRLVSLPGRSVVTAKSRRTGGVKLTVDVARLVHLWVGGAELPEIGEELLPQVEEPGLRAEQLADLVGDLLEVHLPWSLGLAIWWANDMRASDEAISDELPTEVTALLRWGGLTAKPPSDFSLVVLLPDHWRIASSQRGLEAKTTPTC
jgi:hypothetical protein